MIAEPLCQSQSKRQKAALPEGKIELRVLALIIDVAVCFGSLRLAMSGMGWIREEVGGSALFLLPFWFALFFVWPFLSGKPNMYWRGENCKMSSVSWNDNFGVLKPR